MPNKKPDKDAKRPHETNGNHPPSAKKEAAAASSNKAEKGRKKTDGRDSLLKEESREFYENGLREQLGEIEEQVTELESGMESENWEPASDYERLTDDIHIQLAEAREKVDSLESASDREWGALYREAQEAVQAVGELSQKINDIIKDFLPE